MSQQPVNTSQSGMRRISDSVRMTETMQREGVNRQPTLAPRGFMANRGAAAPTWIIRITDVSPGYYIPLRRGVMLYITGLDSQENPIYETIGDGSPNAFVLQERNRIVAQGDELICLHVSTHEGDGLFKQISSSSNEVIEECELICECEHLPGGAVAEYTLVLSGVTPNPSTLELNGTYTLTHVSDCIWEASWPDGGTIRLFYDAGDMSFPWKLHFGFGQTIDAEYRSTSFDGLEGSTFNRNSVNKHTNWPTDITLSPTCIPTIDYTPRLYKITSVDDSGDETSYTARLISRDVDGNWVEVSPTVEIEPAYQVPVSAGAEVDDLTTGAFVLGQRSQNAACNWEVIRFEGELSEYPYATPILDGIVSTTTQSFGGHKTFVGEAFTVDTSGQDFNILPTTLTFGEKVFLYYNYGSTGPSIRNEYALLGHSVGTANIGSKNTIRSDKGYVYDDGDCFVYIPNEEFTIRTNPGSTGQINVRGETSQLFVTATTYSFQINCAFQTGDPDGENGFRIFTTDESNGHLYAAVNDGGLACWGVSRRRFVSPGFVNDYHHGIDANISIPNDDGSSQSLVFKGGLLVGSFFIAAPPPPPPPP